MKKTIITILLTLFFAFTLNAQAPNNFKRLVFMDVEIPVAANKVDYTSFTTAVLFGTSINTTISPYLRCAQNVSASDSAKIDNASGNMPSGWAMAFADSCHAHGIPVMLSFNIGSIFGIPITGWDTSANNRHVFENYFANKDNGWCKRHHIDGAWWDYEDVPASDPGWKLLVRELNDTGATWTNSKWYQGMDVDIYVEKGLDTATANNCFNAGVWIMAYGMNGGGNDIGFYSPLFQPTSEDPTYSTGKTSWFGDTYNQEGVYWWVNYGVHKNVLGVLLPFECIYATGVNTPFATGGSKHYYNGYPAVYAAEQTGTPLGYTEQYDSIAQEAWYGYTTSNGTKYYYPFENYRSIKAKVDTLWNGNFLGVGIWHLGIGYSTSVPVPDQPLQWFKQAVNTHLGIIPPVTSLTVSLVTSPSGITTDSIGKQMSFFGTVTGGQPDSITYFRGVQGGPYYWVVSITGTTSWTTYWTPTTAGNWTSYYVAYKSGTGYTSNMITITVPTVVVPPPPVTSCWSRAEVDSAAYADSVKGYGLGFTAGKNSVICPACPPVPYCPDSVKGYTNGFTAGKASVVCPPVPYCPDSTKVYNFGFTAGKASVVCPPVPYCPDSVAGYSKGFNSGNTAGYNLGFTAGKATCTDTTGLFTKGANYYKSLVPNTVSGWMYKVLPDGTKIDSILVTLPVPKP